MELSWQNVRWSTFCFASNNKMREMRSGVSLIGSLRRAMCLYSTDSKATTLHFYLGLMRSRFFFAVAARSLQHQPLSVCFNNIRVWAWLLISYIKRRRRHSSSSRFCAPLSRRASASLMKFCSRSWALGKRRRTFHSIPCAALLSAFCSGPCSAHSIHPSTLSL